MNTGDQDMQDQPGRVYKHSAETRRRMSEAHKGRKYRLGTKHSEEPKQKISESHKGKTFSEEHCKRISEALRGRLVSEETKQRMSLAAKAYHARRKAQASDSPDH